MSESFVIQSDNANLPYVEERLFHFCSECNIGNYYSTVSVAALQAVETAIHFGNGDSNISVELGVCRGGVYVEICGEGNLFVDLFSDSFDVSGNGKGLFIIRSLSDRVMCFEGGRKVRLEFDVNGVDPADVLERISVLHSFMPLAVA